MYTQEKIKEMNDLVVKTITTGTIKREDKEKLETVLHFITGQSWKGKCLGCTMHQISKILNAYYKQLLQTPQPIVVNESKTLPPIETVSQDTVSQDTVSQDTVSQDTVSQDTVSQTNSLDNISNPSDDNTVSLPNDTGDNSPELNKKKRGRPFKN